MLCCAVPQIIAGVAADGRMIVNRAMNEATNYKK